MKIFGYIGAIDPDKYDIFLSIQKNALGNITLDNLKEENNQNFEGNESEKSFRKKIKKKI